MLLKIQAFFSTKYTENKGLLRRLLSKGLHKGMVVIYHHSTIIGVIDHETLNAFQMS